MSEEQSLEGNRKSEQIYSDAGIEVDSFFLLKCQFVLF